MYKDRQTFGLDLFFLASQKWELFDFVFLCCYANYLVQKQKLLCIIYILILEAKFARNCVHYTWVNTV